MSSAPPELTPRTPPWPLRWPERVLDLADMLADYDAPAYLVGGAVRDALLGREVMDVDICTPSSGTRLARHIANQLGGAYYPLDPERDVGRALVTADGVRLVFDVARFRGDDLGADLADRDFTTNAMAVDLRGDLSLVIDPLGGAEDTTGKLLRRCRPDSLARDPIRTLRAVRLSAQLGFRLDRDTLRDARATGPRLAAISPERVRDEFIKLLSMPDPAAALRVADALGLLAVVVPETAALHGERGTDSAAFDAWERSLLAVEAMTGILATISPRRTDATAAQFSLGMIVMALDPLRRDLIAHVDALWPDERPHRALLVLATLLHLAAPSAADARASALRLSNTERLRLVGAIRHYPALYGVDTRSPLTIYRYWRAAGEAGVDATLLALAVYLGKHGLALGQDAWLREVERAQRVLAAWYRQRDTLVDPPALVDGHGLMKALGLRRGPLVGELLERVREAQVTGEVRTADDALALARALAAERDAGKRGG